MLKRKSLIWITFLISAIIFGMLVFCVLGKGESYNFNISRINEILKEMLTKGISGAPYRIYTWDNAAYGSGKPLLYGDLFLYIPKYQIKAIDSRMCLCHCVSGKNFEKTVERK